MRARLLGLLRLRASEESRNRGRTGVPDGYADRVHAELAEELPDEDLGEDLADFLDSYERGSRPGPDEEEFLATVRDALERIERGRGRPGIGPGSCPEGLT
ncbi:hypothetical protein QOM21_20400 [Streptomyces sp. Pv4-95]|uniref:hypothetical protein n=1 Tax=Streptomyces sp. Pv4-95 TaxID=3049543 RepID=UPI00389245C9